MSLPKFETLLLHQTEDGILTITLNRPAVKNAFNEQMFLDVPKALTHAKNDDKILVVVVTGSGDYFSSGADLTGSVVNEEVHSRIQPVGLFMWEFMHFPKPIIALVNGPAVGVGFTMLPHCDFVLCTQDAFFWSPFARVALNPEMVSSLLFREIFGISVTNELFLAGRKLTAQDAYHYRFVSKVTRTNEELKKEGMALAREMLAHPIPEKTLPLFKRLVKYPGRIELLRSIHEMEMDALTTRTRNGETAEGVASFIQKQQEEKAKAKAKGGSKL